MKKYKNPFNLFSSARYRKKNKKDIFPYFGFKVFFGKYGSGKTISCVQEALDITSKYKDIVFITNTAIKRYW